MFLKIFPPAKIHFQKLMKAEAKIVSLLKELETENKLLKQEIAKNKVRISLLEYKLS